ncbi:unnamed protein product [Somion occarium]|uniref:Uncharacterized protein n=1 Tax=Somion occarium TaxID=3059160 RepID=A0ABP1CU73_9APHY
MTSTSREDLPPAPSHKLPLPNFSCGRDDVALWDPSQIPVYGYGYVLDDKWLIDFHANEIRGQDHLLPIQKTLSAMSLIATRLHSMGTYFVLIKEEPREWATCFVSGLNFNKTRALDTTRVEKLKRAIGTDEEPKWYPVHCSDDH